MKQVRSVIQLMTMAACQGNRQQARPPPILGESGTAAVGIFTLTKEDAK